MKIALKEFEHMCFVSLLITPPGWLFAIRLVYLDTHVKS